jgi:hypothetical protein
MYLWDVVLHTIPKMVCDEIYAFEDER